MAQWGMLVPAFLLLAIFFFYPLIVMAKFSLFEHGFSFAPFRAIYSSDVYSINFLYTLKISVIVTVVCVLLGYPIAVMMVKAQPTTLRLLIIAIAVPYFTSMVVRAYAWMIILGNKGIINDLLLASGIVDYPVQLMYTQTAVVIGTAYILLPYMILTVYAALKNINPAVMNAATSLGASEIYAFIRVYLPLSAPGLIGGSILVFLLCLGYFVTPSLMGGPSRQMIGVLIQNEIEVNVNWAMASALSLVLLLVTLGIVFIYSRFVNLGKILQGGI